MSRIVEVSAAARLHFGLLSFGRKDGRQFGGAGVMIDHPRVNLTITESDQFAAQGPSVDRVSEFAHSWSRHHAIELRCAIATSSVIPSHSGLGSGTQLGLAVARGLNKFFDRESTSIEQLVKSVDRGKRSAVGSYGFVHGGFIAESGRRADDELGELLMRCELPKAWTIVLVRRRNCVGLSGVAERKAFDTDLPAIPRKTTEEMTNILAERIVPAAKAGNLNRFGAAVHDYGVLAGDCFRVVQGGTYASHEAQAIVKFLMDQSVVGVGQSSWGPTLFGFIENETRAETVMELVKESRLCVDWECELVKIENDGAKVTKHE